MPYHEPAYYKDRSELDDMKDETIYLDRALAALADAPDSDFIVRIYNEMDQRRLALLREISAG